VREHGCSRRRLTGVGASQSRMPPLEQRAGACHRGADAALQRPVSAAPGPLQLPVLVDGGDAVDGPPTRNGGKVWPVNEPP
jgi:hypothetical protein